MTEYTREEILDKNFDIVEFASEYGYQFEEKGGFPLERVPGEGLYQRSSYLDANRKSKAYLANMDEDMRIHTFGALGNQLNASKFFRRMFKYPLVFFAGVAITLCAKGCGQNQPNHAKMPTAKIQKHTCL